MDANKDYYSILGVHPSNEKVVIDSEYKELAKRYHPDKNQNDPENAKRQMQEINSSFYEIVMNKFRIIDSKMNLLITGSCGHIGSYILENINKIRFVKKIYIVDDLSTNRYNSLFNLPKTKGRIPNGSLIPINFLSVKIVNA